jgi:type IV pilus assembly protein PilY1
MRRLVTFRKKMNSIRMLVNRLRRMPLALTLAGLAAASNAVTLADSPLFSTVSVPGNVALALSVEWPTATTPSYPSTTAYSAASTYVGYFDPEKCYQYVAVDTGKEGKSDYSTSYFKPHSAASSHACASKAGTPLWSGNYMNWVSMQTLDVFRWALTGGYRTTDQVGKTILTKTYADKVGGGTKAPDKTLTSGVSGATPFDWTSVTTSIKNRGVAMFITGERVSKDGMGNTWGCVRGSPCLNSNDAIDYVAQSSYAGKDDSEKDSKKDSKKESASKADPETIYRLYINVQVCDPTVSLEGNCVGYGKDNYKPEGLIQTYSSTLRFAAFGYLDDSTVTRDGGVLRAPMKYVGPTQPVPGSRPVANPAAEWDPATGIMVTNPDKELAKSSSTSSGVEISQSGVMNYLNKFGLVSAGDKRYKNFDPVSELYYSTLRYFRNVGPVGAYSAKSGASAEEEKQYLDGFPVATEWTDPMLYSCQKNFVLGIGDVNTHRDGNLPGSSLWTGGQEPSTPPEVTDDYKKNGVDVTKSTKMVAQLEGLSSSIATKYMTGRYNTYYIAGLAYDAHTVDTRQDLPGEQTVNTYWVDVMEDQEFQAKNQYWLAAKYGGFTVPEGFSPYSASNDTSTLPTSSWHANTDSLTSLSGVVNERPDNYFAAYQGKAMLSGLSAAFAKMSTEAASTTTTAFSPLNRKTSAGGTTNYSASYDPKSWTGKVVASTLVANTDGTTTSTEKWDAQAILDSTAVGTRKIVTCCTASGAGLEFTSAALADAQLSSRTNVASFGSVPGVAADKQSSADFINYLRGDRTKEVKNGGPYRDRVHLLGDIVDSKLEVVGAPSFSYYEKYNPGYSSFKSTYASRDTIVYVGANDGMMHAFDGSISSSTRGTERFAYIPSFAYGDSATTSDRYFASYGLASLGNPAYSHHYFVNATPKQFDVDLGNARSSASAKAGTPDWRTLLIGGMGKGGKGYYAIDVTDPSKWQSASAVAGKVMWEFTDSRMGYTFGDAHVVKTAKYGWVAILPSGYNNSDGKGYIFLVNPNSGALLDAIPTPTGSTSSPINLAHIRAFINNYDDYTADAVYAGDLQGNLWRFDLTGTGTYPDAKLIAKVTNSDDVALPVTTPPLLGVDPTTKKRYVMVGTGQQLSDSDVNNGTLQAFYAIVDGTGDTGGFYTDTTLPTGYEFPLERKKLTAVTSFMSELGEDASPMGWYYDFSSSSKGVAERVNVEGDVALGMVAFSANLPNGDACSPGGSSRTFAVRFATAKSSLVDSAGSVEEYIADSNTTVDLLITKSPSDGQLSLTRGGVSTGMSSSVTNTSLENVLSKFKFLNWRELSTVD